MNLLNREGWLVTFVILSSIYAQAFADVCDDCEGLQCHHGCTINETGHCRCNICNKGYELALNQQNCTDVNECDALNGMCSHNCSNTEGSYNCFCPMGMKLNKDKTTCSGCPDGTYGVNCANNCACGVGSLTCDSKVGCVCKTGWEGDKCDIDINECNNASMRSECQNKLANCSNFQGGYTCRCPEGYKQNENKTCQDINECALVTTNNCTQHCENTAGSYRCSCNLTSYVLDNDNATCIDFTGMAVTSIRIVLLICGLGAFIATNAADDSLRAQFNLLDLNLDGKLSLQELLAAFDKKDANKDGAHSVPEYFELPNGANIPESLRQVFNTYDEIDGMVDGLMQRSSIQVIFHTLDVNGNGDINFTEAFGEE